MTEALSNDEYENLYAWLNSIELPKAKKNLARDFADGCLMAALIKKFYPRLVELHNYPTASSLYKKVVNWTLLNKKVLTPLGMKLSDEEMKSIASSAKGAIEPLLLQLKSKTESDNINDESNVYYSYVKDLPCEDGVPVRNIIELQEYNRLREKYESLLEEIGFMTSKISHLESLVELKDQRIEDLSLQLRRCQYHCKGVKSNISIPESSAMSGDEDEFDDC